MPAGAHTDLEGLGVLPEEVRGVGTRPHMGKGGRDVIPKLSIHPNRSVAILEDAQGVSVPHPYTDQRSGLQPAQCLSAGWSPADKIGPEAENKKENLVEQEPSPAAAAAIASGGFSLAERFPAVHREEQRCCPTTRIHTPSPPLLESLELSLQTPVRWDSTGLGACLTTSCLWEGKTRSQVPAQR